MQICIGTKLGVHSKIFAVSFCYQLSKSIGHTSNSKLQGCPITYVRQKILCNLSVNLRRHIRLACRKRFMLSLYDIIHLRHMNTFSISAVYLWHMLVDFYDNNICILHNRPGNSGIYRIIKISMLVHR